MNWGTKIAIVYSVFVVMIVALGVSSARQKSDLVSTDYYEKEVKYQEKIDGMKNTSGLDGKFTFDVEAGTVTLRYPAALCGKKVKGEILFYRPSDSDKDEHFIPAPDKDGVQQLKLKSPQKGIYTLQCDMEVEGKKYYFEEPVQLN
jgi:hypothetical protein